MHARGKAISYVLKMSKEMSEVLTVFLKTSNPTLSNQLNKMLSESK